MLTCNFSYFISLLCVLVLPIPLATAEKEKISPNLAILTIAGDIQKHNVTFGSDHQTSFFNHYDIELKAAYQFDRASLLKLPQKTITTQLPKAPHKMTFSGPLFKDVLETVGAAKKLIKILALDGFAIELTQEKIAAHDWLLALSADEKPLSIGGRGPLWLVHTPSSGQTASEEEEQSWPWAIFYIEVGGS